MNTHDFEVHRAIVHYSNPSTGEAQVRVPALLGVGEVVSIPTVGLTNSDGFWNVPSVGSSLFIAVSTDRTQFLWLTAVGISGSGGDTPSNEPIGHEDRTGSLMAFDNATRTFSIQPVNSFYVVWCVGLRYEKVIMESVQIPNITGLYYISFNSQGQLQYNNDYFAWDQDCPTAYVYWNSTTQRAEFFADERHGITMDWQTHEYLHRTRGAAYANGFDASNFDVSTHDGNTDAQAQLDIDNGTFFDEDLQVDVRHSLAPAINTWEQQLQGPARIPVFYRSGTGYVYDDPTDFPVKQGVTHPVYNSSSGGNWGTTELGTNKYGIQWIVATNQLNYPVLSIMGQTQYSNIGQAEAASWADMDLAGLPVVEIRVLYKIIFRATGSNTPGCYFVEIDDYRTALSNATSTAAAVVDHGNLTGLGDDDHPQYLLNSSTTNFPTSLDAGLPDSIEALQAKVGVDGSAVTTSLDYKVAGLGSSVAALQTGGRLFARAIYTSTTTITIPANARYCHAIVTSGGGGGGGALSTNSTQVNVGQGGAGGWTVSCFLDGTAGYFTAGASLTVGVGAGGSGFTGGQGSPGGYSYLLEGSTELVFVGGAYGGQVTSSSQAIPRVQPFNFDESWPPWVYYVRSVGGVDAPNVLHHKPPRGYGFVVSPAQFVSGEGQSSLFGVGRAARFGGSGNGLTTYNGGNSAYPGYGGGGGGASNGPSQVTNRAGSSGIGGIIILDWYA